MEITDDDILNTLTRMQQKYALTTHEEDDLIHIDGEGVEEPFHLTVAKSDCALVGEAWHIHFDDPPFTLESVLEGLFSGAIYIVVKYRGNQPVAEQVIAVREDGTRYVLSRCSVLPSPFWRPKSYKTFTYKLPLRTD